MRTRLLGVTLVALCGGLCVGTTSARAAASRGRLLVAGPDRPVFTEGFVLRARLIGGDRVVSLPTRRQPAPLVDARLSPGRYTLRLEVRPCDANCGHLDASLRCSARIRVRAAETTRARLTVGRSPRCRVLVSGRS